MKITDFLKDNILFLDGGMGTILHSQGLMPGELPERWCISHPEVIKSVHRAYFDAGSNVVNTNTFGASTLKFSPDELEEIVREAIKCAREASRESKGEQEKFVALDIGPLGRMLKPYGDLDFEDAVKIFSDTISLGDRYGADLVFIETMNDSYETKAALLAAKETTSLPVFVSNAYGDDGKLMTGASPLSMVAMLEGMGADAIGVNCSLGPRALSSVVHEYLKNSSLPVILKPNAGLPRVEGGKTVYDVSARDFACEVRTLVEAGVRIAGGCCGTTPEYISALTSECKALSPVTIEKKSTTVVSSYTHAVTLGERPVLIGERINPTGKKKLRAALIDGDMDYVLKQGLEQEQNGAHILDVNVGLPELDEDAVLMRTVCELQAIIDLPLQIDTASPSAMEKALRRYNGKAMINSVNGKKESMDKIFPLVKKYGGVVVALTLDENGIPETADERFAIAERILAEAKKYGIDKKDIIFDTLAMTVSADKSAALETLRALSLIRERLGCHTSLGVSNVSFGLPARDAINGTFFALALNCGLSAAIMNPSSHEMMKTYYSYCALTGQDENFEEYISHSDEFLSQKTTPVDQKQSAQDECDSASSRLKYAIIKGLKENAATLTEELLKEAEPMDIVQSEVIPALNTVGEGFENKTVYLPQLLMSAEAAKCAFEVIKSAMPKGSSNTNGVFILATVKGDIHDIGKNIVRLLLENYGFDVRDLGRDVPAEDIVKATVELHASVVGLSALMTTTVPAMQETISLLRERAPWCKVVVGGAVLTQEYADTIGADFYARDAMEGVRYAQSVCKQGEL